MRVKTFRALVASLCCLALLASSGCYGKSAVTSSIIKWHHGLDMDKFPKECIYVPLFFFVIPITGFVDNFILNAIDFWTKDDPLKAAMGPDGAPDGKPQDGVPQDGIPQDEKPQLAQERAEASDGPTLVADLPDRD